MKPAVGAGLVTLLGTVQIALASAVSAVIGHFLNGSFPVANSSYTATCGLSMQSSSICIAGYVSTAITVVGLLLVMGMQCAVVEGKLSKYGFSGPLLCLVGFFWWMAYGAAATVAAQSGNHWDLSLTTYRTVVVALSWCIMALFIPSFLASAMTVSAAASAATRAAELRLGGRSLRRFSQPASPPVSPAKSNKSFNSAYEPFKDSESPKKWVQPYNPNSSRFAVTSDGLRTLLVVDGQPVPLSPFHSPAGSPARSPQAQSPVVRSPRSHSPSMRSPVLRSIHMSSAGSFSNILLTDEALNLSSHPAHSAS